MVLRGVQEGGLIVGLLLHPACERSRGREATEFSPCRGKWEQPNTVTEA